MAEEGTTQAGDESRPTTALDHVLRGLQDAVVKAQRLANDQHFDMLNDFLKRGRIINIEKLFTVITRGDAQVVMEYCAYHIGFKRRPTGL